MRFKVHYSYNLDLLNFVNILTGSDLYTNWHKGIYERFRPLLSTSAMKSLENSVEKNGSTMLGPLMSLVVSAVPRFERRSILRMLSDTELLRESFSRYSYYNEDTWDAKAELFGTLLPLIDELENSGFREYWKDERLPLIKQKQRRFQAYASTFHLDGEIELMLGRGSAPESVTVYLCTFAAPHGIKICGPRYITDVVFPREASLGIAVHELFHPPYDASHLETELEGLGKDPLLQHAFETKDPRFGYSTMTGFIEENVVEAMAIHICHKIGLEKDPLKYFAEHDGGSHMLSVVLFDYFGKFPKSAEQSFEAYFIELLKELPVGSLDQEYKRIMDIKKVT